jgi:hypothetical protein
MSPISTFAIALEIRAGRIPVRWTARDHRVEELRDVDGRIIGKGRTERVLWPEVETAKGGDTEVSELDGPLDLQASLFKALNTNRSEKAALAFLDRGGAWRMVDGGVPEAEVWAKGTYTRFAYRHRLALNMRVLPVTLDELWGEAEYWYRLQCSLGEPKKLKKERPFSQPPEANARPHDLFSYATEAHYANTMPVSLEWSGTDPRAVVEPVTATELLACAAWAGIAGKVPLYVCAGCKTRFASPRKRKYCLWECGHLEAVRNHKRMLARAKAIVRTNPGLSTSKLLAKLEEADIKRTRDWVVKARGAK